MIIFNKMKAFNINLYLNLHLKKYIHKLVFQHIVNKIKQFSFIHSRDMRMVVHWLVAPLLKKIKKILKLY